MERFLTSVIHEYSERVEILRSSGGFIRGVTRVIVVGLGLLVLLDSFGISVTPVLASLGIGSLAVALALQPTLENLFAGGADRHRQTDPGGAFYQAGIRRRRLRAQDRVASPRGSGCCRITW